MSLGCLVSVLFINQEPFLSPRTPPKPLYPLASLTWRDLVSGVAKTPGPVFGIEMASVTEILGWI